MSNCRPRGEFQYIWSADAMTKEACGTKCCSIPPIYIPGLNHLVANFSYRFKSMEAKIWLCCCDMVLCPSAEEIHNEQGMPPKSVAHTNHPVRSDSSWAPITHQLYFWRQRLYRFLSFSLQPEYILGGLYREMRFRTRFSLRWSLRRPLLLCTFHQHW